MATAKPYGTLPYTPQGITVKPYTIAIADSTLQSFKGLLRLSPLGPKTYENTHSPDPAHLGLSYEWMSTAKSYWESTYSWRARESYFNSFPHFTARIQDDEDEGGNVVNVHFCGLFSRREDAVPVLFSHGWPGSFLEFLGLFEVFRRKYPEGEMPYHLIAVSLPGYTLSDGPPTGRDWANEDTARILNKLMCGLGFGGGYAAQGGDIGSFVSRILATQYEGCKAMHLNFCNTGEPKSKPKVDKLGEEAIKIATAFRRTGSAYALEHGTRPATVGFTLASSPLAVLAWIGEKFLTWTDETPSLEHILDSITLYWLTETFARCIYSYRQAFSKGPDRYFLHEDEKFYCKKPFGFSYFPKEIYPMPQEWIATTGDLTFFKRHDKGGHFAAMEQPELLAQDVEDFLKQVWKK